MRLCVARKALPQLTSHKDTGASGWLFCCGQCTHKWWHAEEPPEAELAGSGVDVDEPAPSEPESPTGTGGGALDEIKRLLTEFAEEHPDANDANKREVYEAVGCAGAQKGPVFVESPESQAAKSPPLPERTPAVGSSKKPKDRKQRWLNKEGKVGSAFFPKKNVRRTGDKSWKPTSSPISADADRQYSYKRISTKEMLTKDRPATPAEPIPQQTGFSPKESQVEGQGVTKKNSLLKPFRPVTLKPAEKLRSEAQIVPDFSSLKKEGALPTERTRKMHTVVKTAVHSGLLRRVFSKKIKESTDAEAEPDHYENSSNTFGAFLSKLPESDPEPTPLTTEERCISNTEEEWVDEKTVKIPTDVKTAVRLGLLHRAFSKKTKKPADSGKPHEKRSDKTVDVLLREPPKLTFRPAFLMKRRSYIAIQNSGSVELLDFSGLEDSTHDGGVSPHRFNVGVTAGNWQNVGVADNWQVGSGERSPWSHDVPDSWPLIEQQEWRGLAAEENAADEKNIRDEEVDAGSFFNRSSIRNQDFPQPASLKLRRTRKVKREPLAHQEETRHEGCGRRKKFAFIWLAVCLSTLAAATLTNKYKDTAIDLWKTSAYSRAMYSKAPLDFQNVMYAVAGSRIVVVGEVVNRGDASLPMPTVEISVTINGIRQMSWRYFPKPKRILPYEHIFFRTENDISSVGTLNGRVESNEDLSETDNIVVETSFF